MKRPLRIGATLIVLALALTYILHKIDVHRTAQILGSVHPLWSRSPHR